MTTLSVDVSDLADGQQADAGDVSTPINELKTHLENTLDGDQAFEQINFAAATELTLDASGAITVAQTLHTVDTFGDASSDHLDDITMVEGDVVFLQAANAARTVVVRNNGGGTGNIRTASGGDISLDDTVKVLMAVRLGSLVYVVGIYASDASNVTFTPTTLTDWDGDSDPGNIDDALDQLAERVDDNEILINAVAILRDEKATGTDGGGSAATTWNNRDLNTEVSDPQNIVSISSNQFTPVSGVYKIYAVASAKRADGHRLRLYNVTQASVVQEGKNAISQDATNVPATNATLSHVFSANGTDAYRIDHYTTNSFATSGLGNAVSDGSNEVYMTILLEKVG